MTSKDYDINVFYSNMAIQSNPLGMSWKLITKPSKFNYALIDCLLPFLYRQLALPLFSGFFSAFSEYYRRRLLPRRLFSSTRRRAAN